MAKPLIAAAYLRKRLRYDAKTGIFTWFPKKGSDRITNGWNARNANQAAGGMTGQGYDSIGIDGVQYLSHRLAWLYVHGEWPKHHIDHINRNRMDNRIENLRDVTSTKNQINTWRRPAASGYRNVYFHKPSNLYQAKIFRNGKQISFGYFKTPEEASSIVKEKIKEIDEA